MKTRPLVLLVPVLALAAGYLAWDTGWFDSPPAQQLASTPPEISTPAKVPAVVRNEPLEQHLLNDPGCNVVTRYLPNDDGTVLALLACEKPDEPEKHPYESYSSEALESLAYADAKAAEILGMRLRESDLARSMSLMIRASALSGGDTKAIERSYTTYPHPHQVDGIPDRNTIHAKFVLAAVIDLLSDDSFLAAPWEEEIRRHSSDPETEIALLYKRVQQIVDDMRQIELDVTGSSTIGGPDDA